MCPILSAKYSSSLNVYHTVSHVKITMPQHEPANNPNRFAIRDPRGGYWMWDQNMEIICINRSILCIYDINRVNTQHIYFPILKPSLVQIYQGIYLWGGAHRLE